jgi:DNA-binding NtrC family response regulator
MGDAVAADILVVDDDAELAGLVELVLLDAGHTVRLATNGIEGLVCLTEKVPDLVITDVDMPLLNGAEMAERMFVENLGKENVPVVVVSAGDGVATVASKVGTPYYLAKPWTLERFLALINRALRERALPRPHW